jgi:hypothetical protein
MKKSNVVMDMKTRYELAHKKVFSELPKWKQEILKNPNETYHHKEFGKKVMALAENEEIALSE